MSASAADIANAAATIAPTRLPVAIALAAVAVDADFVFLATAGGAAASPIDAAIAAAITVGDTNRVRGSATAEAAFARAAATLPVTAAGRAGRLAGAEAVDACPAATTNVIGACAAALGTDATGMDAITDIAATVAVLNAAELCPAAIANVVRRAMTRAAFRVVVLARLTGPKAGGSWPGLTFAADWIEQIAFVADDVAAPVLQPRRRFGRNAENDGRHAGATTHVTNLDIPAR